LRDLKNEEKNESAEILQELIIVVNQKILTMEEELDLVLKQAEDLLKKSDNFSKLKQEYLLFINPGKRTYNLENLFKAVSTVKPTSTSKERTFSVCTNLCTKIRSRLADKSLLALVFLKYYYIRAKKVNEVKKVH
jgi:hypothetical protein